MPMYEQFATNSDFERQGVEVDYGEFRVRLARAGGANKRFARVLEHKSRPFRRAIQADTMDRDKADAILRETYAEAVVLNWEVRIEDTQTGDERWVQGIENPEGGDPLPFNRDNVLRTLEALPDLFQELQEQASRISLYREQLLEDEAGN